MTVSIQSMGGKARWRGTTKAQRRAEMMKLVEARRLKASRDTV